MLGWELLVVLSVFPLDSTIVALYAMAQHLFTGQDVASGGPVIPHEQLVSILFAVALQLVELAGAGLVFYLLWRSGEGPAAIGLGRGGFRSDLALLLPVWFLTQVIPQDAGSAVLRATKLTPFHILSPAEPASFVIVGIAMSLVAGIVEEIVVLGYLVRRMEQRGWGATAVVVAAVAVRVSYHLYYGPGVLPIALWALATVLLYRRVRRLFPFIACHVLWDAHLAIATDSTTVANMLVLSFIVAGLAFLVTWRRSAWRSDRKMPIALPQRPT